jgi:amino acid adenylation domain-containing protein
MEINDPKHSMTSLSSNQLLFWTGQKLRPGNPIYSIPCVFTIHGNIDEKAFRAAFRNLVARTDSLRTVIVEVDGLPVERVTMGIPSDLVILDISDSADPQAASRDWITAKVAIPLDPEKCIYSSALIKLSRDEYIWFFNQHHMLADGWTVALLYQRMIELYKEAQGKPSSASDKYPSFHVYLGDQRVRAGTADYQREKTYWEQKFSEDLEPIHFYGNSSAKKTDLGQKVSVNLGAERTARLKRVCSQKPFFRGNLNVALFNALLTVVAAYLYRVGDCRHISLGVPLHNRRVSVNDKTAGLVMQTVVLHTMVEEEDTFVKLWGKIFQESLEASHNSDYAIRNPPQKPVYEVFFNFMGIAFSNFDGNPVTVDWIFPGYVEDQLAIHIHDFCSSGELTIDFNFAADIFSLQQQEQATGHFLALLDAFLVQPEQPLDEIDILSTEEKQYLLYDLNRNETTYPEGLVLHRLFELQEEKTPDAIAVVHGTRSLTYRELNQGANQLAHLLQEKGVGPEVRVGVCFRRSVEMIVAILGILKAGGAYVPLDDELPPERLAFLLMDVSPILVLTHQPVQEKLSTAKMPVICLDTEWEQISRFPTENPECRVRPENLAYVIYTSGTTGVPKGVMVQHSGLCNRFVWELAAYPKDSSDRLLQHMSLSFDYSVFEIFIALTAGARLVLADQDRRLDYDYLVRLIQEQEITIASFVPAQLRLFLVAPRVEECRSLRLVFCSADVLDLHLQEEFFGKLNAQLYNTYGPTEATIDVLHWACKKGDVLPQVPIGRPIANTQIYILNSRLQPVPMGVAGELFIGGVQVSRGYLNQPELTAGKFIPNPFGTRLDARLYRTGDVGRYLSDGNIEFLGRLDQQVKVRGYRIELGEIETVLRKHPAVRDAAVVLKESLPDQKWLVAYFVPEGDQHPTAAELRRFLKERLPAYMLPAQFIQVDSFRLTANGKLDHASLPEPGSQRPVITNDTLAPRTELERSLARIWEAVLKVEQVGIQDDFFDLGGDSLQGIALLLEVEKQFGKKLPLNFLIEHSTIEKLAGWLSIGTGTAENHWPLIYLQSKGQKAPLFLAPGIGGGLIYMQHFAALLGTERPIIGMQYEDDYLIPNLVTIEGLATRLLEQIRTVQPHGPYYLAGHSYGGYLILEIGRSLLEFGEDVALLVLLDSLPPGPQRQASPTARFRVHINNFRKAANRQNTLKYLRARMTGAFLHLYRFQPFQAWFDHLGLGPREKVPSRLMPFIKYNPQPYPGNVLLFKATERPAYVTWDPMDNWQKYISGELEVREVSGEHGNLVKDPFVDELARQLKGYLDKE